MTKDTNDVPEPQFLDCCSLPLEKIRQLSEGTDEYRKKHFIPVSKIGKDDILKVQPMSVWGEILCILFLAYAVPNGVFTLPPTIYVIGKFLVGNVKLTFQVFGLFLIPLIILPQPYVPSTLNSLFAHQISKYFSYRFIIEELPQSDSPRPTVMVAPPHGVFPYGNILAILRWPTVSGSTFRGLAASSALRTPIFKQVLRSIGVIDATRSVARKTLEDGQSIGISTGGVAEIFFTNDDNECILLKERIGLIKLAIRTGADIAPCYLFGNTKLLNCWTGEGIPGAQFILEKISRRVGFALILIYGRFFLPVPFRKPILAICGKVIPTYDIQCEDPTPEQIEIVQTKLLNEMERIFDTYKHLYGWSDKKLIIK